MQVIILARNIPNKLFGIFNSSQNYETSESVNTYRTRGTHILYRQRVSESERMIMLAKKATLKVPMHKMLC